MTGGRVARLAVLIGAIIRAAALPLPGSGDVDAWKVWSYHASTDGVTRLYGAGAPPAYVDFTFHDKIAPVNYPPLALYELGAVGWLYSRATGGRFPDTVSLTVVLKALAVAFDAAIVLLILTAVRRVAGPARARWAALGYWLSPAAILCASVCGYLDTLPALPATGAMVAAAAGWPAAAGALAAAACLTKPQGVLVLPAVALAVWNAGSPPRTRRIGALITGALVVSAVLLAPIAWAGVWANMIFMVRTTFDDQSVSMSGYNLWWLAGHVLTVAHAWTRGATLWAALTLPAGYVSFDRLAAHGLPHLRAAGTLLAAGGIAWGVWVGRRVSDLPRLAAIAAFSVCSYAILATRVHENHAFLAIPLLTVAAAARPRFVPVLAAVSAWFALNLLFYGVTDDGRFVWSRSFTIVDATMLVAVFGCASLWWFGRVLRTECGGELPAFADSILPGSRG